MVLRSNHSNLSLQHTCSILSIKIEVVEMGVVRVVIPKYQIKDRATVKLITDTKVCFITAEKGGVARAKGEGEKEKECTTECKSQRRRELSSRRVENRTRD